MRRFCIDSSYIGSNRHIIGDVEGYTWSESVPRDSWHMTGNFKNSPSSKCLDTLMKLNHSQTTHIPDPHLNSLRSLYTGSAPIPWVHVLPQDVYRNFFKKLLQETTTIFSELPFDYYEVAWSAASRVLSSLKPVKVDQIEMSTLLNVSGSNATVLEGFKPKKSGFANPVTYDRFSTRTGRLTVSDGPNILLLKKDHRKILRSSFESGVICHLDFRALEARIVLAESGRYSDAEDIYGQVAQDQFQNKISRDTVKTAVLAELYGISRSALKSRLGVSDKIIDTFIETIRHHFGVVDLKNRLKCEHETYGRIKNRFGRPLEVPAGQDNLLINTYAQSSGVDVAMLGFDDILQVLGTEGIRPIFVLHDALLLDVREDRIQDVKSIKTAKIPSYKQPFPVKFEQIST